MEWNGMKEGMDGMEWNEWIRMDDRPDLTRTDRIARVFIYGHIQPDWKY